MKQNKALFQLLIQGCINDYGGEYGEPKKVFDEVERCDVGNVQGYFGYLKSDPDTLYNITRGTDEKFDWRQNFRFRKPNIEKWLKNHKNVQLEIPYANLGSDIRTHLGFTIDHFKRRDKILRKIEEFKKYCGTGHSKGGGQETMNVLDGQANFPDKEYISITFASPRVGNEAFQISYDKRVPRTIRVVCREDYITKVPLEIQGYRHVGTKLQLGWENPIFWIPVIRAFGSFFHYPQQYKNLIDRLPDDFEMILQEGKMIVKKAA